MAGIKKRVCRECKFIVANEDAEECPNCGAKGQWNENFQGRTFVFDTTKSVIGQKTGSKIVGEYAIRSRS
jgi:RNA polymerase subunit RPABC4/transcription elongation factor Spt4